MAIIHFKSLPSTNHYIREHHPALNHFDVITCDIQTAGRGRHTHTWYANQDSLVFSMLLKNVPRNEAADLLPFYAAHVTYATLQTYGIELTIKWPNDIYAGDKKIAGILLKRFFDNDNVNIIIGVGININNSVFPKTIRDTASSLFLETGETFDSFRVLNTITDYFKSHYPAFLNHPEETIDDVNNHAYLNNQTISFLCNNKKYYGKCLKTDVSGCLVVQTDKGVMTINSADAHTVRIKKPGSI